MDQNSQHPLKKKTKYSLRFSNWMLFGLFIIMTIVLVGGLIGIYRSQSMEIYTKKSNELKSIAELKVNQILQWREERISDAKIYASDLFLDDVVQSWPNEPANTTHIQDLSNRFDLITQLEGYENVIISSPGGQVMLSLDKSTQVLEPETIQLLSQAIDSDTPVFGDFYRSSITNQVYLDIVSPIKNSHEKPVLFLILQVNPEQLLFPIVQSWPTPSQTAETLLIREDDDTVLFLNTLRHDSSLPLSIRIPLERTDVPAVQAVHGTSGAFEGIDYRGEEVLAEIQPIPGTHWYMIAKEDKSEILSEIYLLARYIIFMIIMTIILTTTLAAYIFNYRQRNLYQNLLQAELTKGQAEEETRTTLYSIGDCVITTNAEGIITRLNPIAEQLTGWVEAEAIGKPLNEVFHIINEISREEAENPVLHVLRDGVIVGLANHTLLIAKDGTEHPIADSGAPIHNKDGEIVGVVMVFRDQTSERLAQKEKELLTDTISASLNEIYIFDAKTLVFRFVNSGALNNLGYRLDEMTTMTPLDLKPEYTLNSFRKLIMPLITREKQMLVFETVHKRANGTLYPVEVHLQMFHHETDNVFLAVIQDITDKLQADEKIRYTEDRYRLLFNEMEEGFALHEIICDENGTPIDYIFLDINPAFEKLTGLQKENIIGRRILDAIPDTESFWIETYGKVALTRITHKCENYVESINKWFAVSAFSPKENQFATIFSDVTDQRMSAQILIESEEKFRTLYETMVQGVIYHDVTGNIILANDAAQNILGLSKEQLHGKSSLDPIWRAIHEDGNAFPGEMHPSFVAQKTGKPVHNVVMGVYNPDKNKFVWININAVPQFRSGENTPYQTFSTFEDITERKDAEEILKHQLDELRRWNNVILGRENRILELKKEINELLIKEGKPPRYKHVKKDNTSHE